MVWVSGSEGRAGMAGELDNRWAGRMAGCMARESDLAHA